jgi:hypothetical protein
LICSDDKLSNDEGSQGHSIQYAGIRLLGDWQVNVTLKKDLLMSFEYGQVWVTTQNLGSVKIAVDGPRITSKAFHLEVLSSLLLSPTTEQRSLLVQPDLLIHKLRNRIRTTFDALLPQCGASVWCELPTFTPRVHEGLIELH